MNETINFDPNVVIDMGWLNVSHRKCDVCGKETDVVACSSAFGGETFAYCNECWKAGAEPYGHMVSFIAAAGHFPEDINLNYQYMVRAILKYLNIKEEKFIKDVEKSISMLDEAYDEYCQENKSEEGDSDEENLFG